MRDPILLCAKPKIAVKNVFRYKTTSKQTFKKLASNYHNENYSLSPSSSFVVFSMLKTKF